LSKEEIKQWRSSLEKITLEEFAARLGKKVEQKKETNDLIDIVLHGKPVVSDDFNWNAPKVERLTSIADKAYEKEKELYVSPFSAQNLKLDKDVKPAKDKKPAAKKSAIKAETPAKPAKTKTLSASKKSAKALETAKQVIETPDTSDMLRNEVRVVFKKALTDREQKVFDYFAAHRNQIVYAKDLAELLSLPRDYVYKYIKNLRAKIDGEALKNADKGGFVLTI
jgi:DNA-binding CsgD family transcriptional regulator